MVAQDVIDAAGRTLAAVAADPVKIVLFGSHARGDLSEGRVLHAAA